MREPGTHTAEELTSLRHKGSRIGTYSQVSGRHDEADKKEERQESEEMKYSQKMPAEAVSE